MGIASPGPAVRALRHPNDQQDAAHSEDLIGTARGINGKKT
jgi:hypothetical protein